MRKRIRDGRNRIAEQDDFGALGRTRQHRRLDVHHCAHTERRAVMLVEHQAIETELVAENLLVDIFVQEPCASRRVEELVRNAKETAPLEDFVLGNGMIRPLGEKHYVHLNDLRGAFNFP